MARSSLALLVVAACTGGAPRNDPSPDATAGDAGADAMSAGELAIARGELWVAAEVPYCQAINHAPDADPSCAAICTRPDDAAWDPYRSDCSGFVSWAWDLPSTGGGRTTAGFAPFETDITYVIAAADLQPGDAVNNSTHMMLFAGWVTPGVEASFLEEPGCSSTTPYAHQFTGNVTLGGNTIDVEYYGTFTAIRLATP